MTAMILGCVASAMAHAGETRTYVVSRFYNAMYSQEGDCPQGLNMSATDLLAYILDEQGVAPAEKQKVMQGSLVTELNRWAAIRGRVDGKPANSYIYPWTVPDRRIRTVLSSKGIGFNLDGRVDKEDFVDPLTGEKGVDNELSRVVGCFEAFRGTPEAAATGAELLWNGVREGMPAWILRVSGMEDTQNDDSVEVQLTRALESVSRDVSGEVQGYGTFTLDPDPRFQNIRFRGSIREGMFLSEAPLDFFMICDSYIMAGFDFQKSRLRLRFRSDGSLEGYLGGFLPWKHVYATFAQPVQEFGWGMDAPSIYHALRRFADHAPDPATREPTRISAAFQIVALPSFVVAEHAPADERQRMDGKGR